MNNFFQRRLLWLSVALVSFASFCAAQSATAAQAPKRATSAPYTGDLSIFDSPDRDQKLHVDRVMDTLGIAPGKTVADIGAGSGWFTVRAARRVGSSGIVYAVDINPEAIRHIDRRAQQESLANVKTVLSKADDPMLPTRAVDAVLILKTYHEIADPITLLNRMVPALKAGARLGIIDRNGNGTDHGISQKTVIEEAEKAGFHLVQTYDFVKDDGMDYFLLFDLP